LKAEAAEAKLAQTIASSKVIIKRVERNKVRPNNSQAMDAVKGWLTQ
jgi:ribosome-binding protein aMBF1 (putative translation factor)